MWKNIVKPGRLQMTVWRMLIAWWIPKAADRLSEYVILLLHNSGCMNVPHCNVPCALPVLLTSAVVIEVCSNTRSGSFTPTKRSCARCPLDMFLGGTRSDLAVTATLLQEIGVQSPVKNIHYTG
jgi:hypothetical protein